MRGEITEKVLALAREQGVMRPRDLVRHGISREMLRYLMNKGVLRKSGRGLYYLPEMVTEYQSLLEISRLFPRGVICLLSALRFHEVGTQNPPEVWMALPPKVWRPKSPKPWVRVVQFSGAAFTSGVEEHRIRGGVLRVFNPAKTVADCFKYRNKVGLDVAIEALRDCLRLHKATMDDLWRYAGICRVQNIMRPYLEAMA